MDFGLKQFINYVIFRTNEAPRHHKGGGPLSIMRLGDSRQKPAAILGSESAPSIIRTLVRVFFVANNL